MCVRYCAWIFYSYFAWPPALAALWANSVTGLSHTLCDKLCVCILCSFCRAQSMCVCVFLAMRRLFLAELRFPTACHSANVAVVVVVGSICNYSKLLACSLLLLLLLCVAITQYNTNAVARTMTTATTATWKWNVKFVGTFTEIEVALRLQFLQILSYVRLLRLHRPKTKKITKIF